MNEELELSGGIPPKSPANPPQIPPSHKRKIKRKLPAFQFYPADWMSDSISGCSLEAQGLWLRMLLQMHNSEHYGYLSTNGKPTPNEVIARHAGVTLLSYETIYNELETAGVPRRTRGGIIYSKRMVEDERKRQEWRQRQQKYRDSIDSMSRNSHAVVSQMSHPSSSSSSNTKITPPTPPSGGHQKPEFIEVHCSGTTILIRNNGRRLWTEGQRAALVGGRIEDYLEFFRRRGFHAEIKSAG